MREQIAGWSAAFTRHGVTYMLTVQACSAAAAARKMEQLTKVKPDARGVVRTFTTNRSLGDVKELYLDEFKAMEGI